MVDYKSKSLPRPQAVKHALEIFNDPWSFAVLQECFFGVRRFDEFQKKLDISRSVLTRRLKHLVNHGILRRQVYNRRPLRYEYRLTEAGIDMYPIFLALNAWGCRWLERSKTSPLNLKHSPCNHSLDIDVVCQHCQAPVSARDVEYE